MLAFLAGVPFLNVGLRCSTPVSWLRAVQGDDVLFVLVDWVGK